MKAAGKKKAPKTKFCTEADCKSEATANGFCRMHYIGHWKTKKLEAKQKAEKRLNSYVDRMTKKFPKDYMEKIKEGLENEEKFNETVAELDMDGEETTETEKEFLEKFLRDIKGDFE